MSESKQLAISLRDVSFSYTKDKAIIDHASFDIEHGEAVCVVGPNGGGKTTLRRLLLGSVKPSSGTVSVYGGQPESQRPRIGYAPQHIHFDRSFPATVRDVVASGCLDSMGLGASKRANDSAVNRAMDAMDIESYENRPLASLSGGELQRVVIARALAGDPDLLLLDEPTSNADPSAENVLLELLSEMGTTITVVMVSHNLDFVSRYVKKVICVHGHVHLHPTHDITSAELNALYGRDIRRVRHDLSLGEGKGHEHDH